MSTKLADKYILPDGSAPKPNSSTSRLDYEELLAHNKELFDRVIELEAHIECDHFEDLGAYRQQRDKALADLDAILIDYRRLNDDEAFRNRGKQRRVLVWTVALVVILIFGVSQPLL